MKREKGLDFARAFAAIGIVVFHFYCHSSSAHKLFLNNANGAWGTAINYLFFALSGYLLQKKYGAQEKLPLLPFYYKRWKATLPAYVAVFLFAYLKNVWQTGSLFYLEIPKWRLLLSFIGMDGYASWVMPTYFITGEWFLGAILVAYAAYPLMRHMANRKCLRYFGLAALVALFGAVSRLPFGGLPLSTNPITCLLSFYLGMLGAEYGDFLRKKTAVAVSFVLCVVAFTVPLNIDSPIPLVLGGCAGLIVLRSIGDFLCKNNAIDKIVRAVSGLTYPVFLIHHRIVVKVLEHFDTVSSLRSLGVLLMVLLTTFVFAKILDVVMKSLFRNPVYLKFEGLFQGKKE